MGRSITPEGEEKRGAGKCPTSSISGERNQEGRGKDYLPFRGGGERKEPSEEQGKKLDRC